MKYCDHHVNCNSKTISTDNDNWSIKYHARQPTIIQLNVLCIKTQHSKLECALWRCKSTPTQQAMLLRMTLHKGPTICMKCHRNTISHFNLIAHYVSWGTSIIGLMRGMATLPKVTRSYYWSETKLEDQVSLG